MVCKAASVSVTYKMPQQHQQLVNNKNRIMIIQGDNPDNYATLKLDLEINGLIVDTFTDPLVALNNFRAGLYAMVVLEKKMSKMNQFIYIKSLRK
jgi:DNA-binding response OmpR family regulator